MTPFAGLIMAGDGLLCGIEVDLIGILHLGYRITPGLVIDLRIPVSDNSGTSRTGY